MTKTPPKTLRVVMPEHSVLKDALRISFTPNHTLMTSYFYRENKFDYVYQARRRPKVQLTWKYYE